MDSKISSDKDYNLWVLLHQVRDAIWKAREKELNQYGITMMEAGILFIVDTVGDGVTPAEISYWAFREHQTTSALLNRMEKKGLITKVKDLDRKNIWRVSLTEKGKAALDQSRRRESIHTALSPLSENERQVLASYLRKVRNEILPRISVEPNLPFP